MLKLARLGDDALVYHPIGSRFESIAAETLGNAGTGADGFDDMHAAVVSQFGQDGDTASTLDPHIAAAEYVDGEFAAVNHSPLVAEIADFQAGGDSLTGETTAGVTPTPPAPPAPPEPVAGGGGGGIGGGGGGGGGGAESPVPSQIVPVVVQDASGFASLQNIEVPVNPTTPPLVYRPGRLDV